MRLGLKLMVDAGVADLETAKKLIKTGVSKVIIGTETLQSKSFVGDAVRAFGKRTGYGELGFEG